MLEAAGVESIAGNSQAIERFGAEHALVGEVVDGEDARHSSPGLAHREPGGDHRERRVPVVRMDHEARRLVVVDAP